MANEFTEIISKEHNGFLRGCPVQIDNTQLLRDSENRLLLRVKLCNLSEKIITEVRFAVECFDEIKDFLGIMPDVAFSSLKAYPHTDFGTDKSVYISFSKTADYNLIPVSVTSEDGTVWKNDEKKKPVPMPMQEKVDKATADGEFLYKINETTGVRVKYWADIHDDYYRCTCGQANEIGVDICTRCGAKKEWIFKYFDKSKIGAEKAAFDARVEDIYNEVTKSLRPKTEEECTEMLLKMKSIAGYKDSAIWITRLEDLSDKLRVKDVKRLTRKDYVIAIAIALGAAVVAFGIVYLILRIIGWL